MEQTLLLQNEELGVQDIPNTIQNLVTIQNDGMEEPSLSLQQKELYNRSPQILKNSDDWKSRSVIMSETDTESAISSVPILKQIPLVSLL